MKCRNGRRIVALDTGFRAELEPDSRVTAEFRDGPPQGKKLLGRNENSLLLKKS